MTFWSRTPLRIKLVATLLVLVAGALGLAGFAAAASLRSYLVSRVDTQLVAGARQYQGDHDGGPGFPGRGPGDGPRPPQQYYVRVVYPDGATVDDPIDGRPAPRLPAVAPDEADGEPFTVSATSGGARWRVVAVRRDVGGVALLARDLTDESSTVARLVSLELVIGAVVLLALGAVGYVLVRQSLRPLAEVETTAAAIAAGDLSRRVPEGDAGTEVGRLSNALNAMLHQIESAFRVREASEVAARRSEERMRRFVADASHELRTPLTSIRGYAELYRQGATTPDEMPRLMRRIEDEGARMGLLVDDLLLLARLDEERPLAHDTVDLVRLAADTVHDARALDPGRAVALDAPDGTCAVVGDEARLRQVLGNLVGNAFRHTPAGTPVEVRLRRDDGYAVVDVVDHGPGLAPEEAHRVFERFYRADPSRARAAGAAAAGGAGLGLAIVAALTEAHGGTVAVSETPGGGATFSVRLPLAAQG
jgi:two-component system OmpR family sensor kinase